MAYQIDKSIEFPKIEKGKKPPKKTSMYNSLGYRTKFIHSLEVGDSFLCNGESERNAYCKAARRKGLIKLVAKKENKDSDQIRIWRIA